MNDHTDTTLTSERAAQMRDLLTDEIRHDAAPSLTTVRERRSTSSPRRVAVGAVAAVLVGGLLFGVNAVAGGPGQAAVPQALAIESVGGSTTIRLTDQDASPDDVIAQLEAAGIPARRLAIDTSQGAEEGTVDLAGASFVVGSDDALGNAAGLIGIMTEAESGEWGQAVFPTADAIGGQMLSSMESMIVPECRDSVLGDLPLTAECEAALADPAALSSHLSGRSDAAIQMHEDGSVTIDDSSGTEIVVLVRG